MPRIPRIQGRRRGSHEVLQVRSIALVLVFVQTCFGTFHLFVQSIKPSERIKSDRKPSSMSRSASAVQVEASPVPCEELLAKRTKGHGPELVPFSVRSELTETKGLGFGKRYGNLNETARHSVQASCCLRSEQNNRASHPLEIKKLLAGVCRIWVLRADQDRSAERRS